MAIDFPASPSVGQQYAYAGVTYTYTATGVWAVTTGTVPPTTPQPVAFRANKNGVNQTITANVETKLTFTTEEYDVGGYFDAPNSRWTPPAGMVHIDAQVPFTGIGDNGTLYVALYKNGVAYRRGIITPSNTTDTIQLSIDDTAGGSDVYELYGFFNTASPVVNGAVIGCYWSGHVIGATQTVQVTTGIGVTTGVVLQKFTASGTYTPTPGMQYAIVECVGGGGGGGGVNFAAAGAGGGGGGGYSRSRLTVAQIGTSQSITVGAGGVGASALAGTAGGDTSFGSLCIARGGGGGSASLGGFYIINGGAGGAAGVGDIVAAGNGGGGGNYNTVNPDSGGMGAPGPFGGGAYGVSNATATTPGVNAGNYGGGGGGAWAASNASLAGGNGSAGIVIITEYVTTAVDASSVGKYVRSDATTTFTTGYTFAPFNLGTLASFTLNPAVGNYQYGTNNAAFTLTVPASDCAVDILITNGATAGAVTFSGFTVGANTGDSYALTNGAKFILSIRRINATSTYVWKALQ